MAGIITLKTGEAGFKTMAKEVPVCPNLEPATAKSLGYISQADISFNVAGTTYSIDAAGNGFTAAGFDGCDGEMILVSSTSGLNDGLYTLVSDADGNLVVTEPVTVETAADAGTVVIYGVAVYKIKPTKRSSNLLIVFSEGVEAAGEVGMIPCALNGDFWVALNTLYKAFPATDVTDATYYLWIESAAYMKSYGYIYFMLKPLATKQLYTDHRPAVGVVELP